jgi:hypothetical protein
MKITFKVHADKASAHDDCSHARRTSSRTSSSSRPSHRRRYADTPPHTLAAHLANTLQIGELKAKIHAEKGWEVAQQKLIYSGALTSWHFAGSHTRDTAADLGH